MNYHIRYIGPRPNYGEITKRNIRVIMHFVVPAGDNSAGKAWSQCILEDVSIQKDTILTDTEITAPEKAAIQAGTVIERVYEVEIHENWSKIEKRLAVDKAWIQRHTETINELAVRYEFWGYAGDIL